MTSDNQLNSFLLRLNFVLGGRKPNPWGGSIGLKGTRIHDIFRQGRTPNAEGLNRIQQAEYASLDWLLNGEGFPFLVHHHLTDHQSANRAGELFCDNWQPYLLMAGNHPQPLLVMKGHVNKALDDGTAVEYDTVRLFANTGDTCLKLAFDAHDTQIVETDLHTLGLYQRGELGGFYLLSLLAHSNAVNVASRVGDARAEFDAAPVGDLTPDIARAARALQQLPETVRDGVVNYIHESEKYLLHNVGLGLHEK